MRADRLPPCEHDGPPARNGDRRQWAMARISQVAVHEQTLVLVLRAQGPQNHRHNVLPDAPYTPIMVRLRILRMRFRAWAYRTGTRVVTMEARRSVACASQAHVDGHLRLVSVSRCDRPVAPTRVWAPRHVLRGPCSLLAQPDVTTLAPEDDACGRMAHHER